MNEVYLIQRINLMIRIKGQLIIAVKKDIEIYTKCFPIITISGDYTHACLGVKIA